MTQGGYWLEEADDTASGSNASKSTASDAGSSADDGVKEVTQIVRTYDIETVGADDEGAYKDDKGYYINLHDSANFPGGDDWNEVQNKNENMTVSAWFDGETYFQEDSLKEIYNGAVLEAVWKSKNIADPAVDATVEEAFGEGNPVIAEDLKDDQRLVISNVDSEEVARCDEELKALLAAEGLELLEGDPKYTIFKLDIDVENHDGNPVTIHLPIPKDLQEGEDEASLRKNLKIIHFKDGKPEIVKNSNVLKGGKYISMTIGDFSPFYLVKAVSQENPEGKVEVTIENVDYGWINASTWEEGQRTFLPLDEPVKLDYGTYLNMNPRGYYTDEWEGILKSISLIPIDSDGKEGEPTVLNDRYGLKVTQNCKLRAEFEKASHEDDEDYYDPFIIELEPDQIGKPADIGGYEAEVQVLQYINGKYREISGWEVRIATAEELKAAGVDLEYGQYAVGMAAFEYNPATKKVTNVAPLNMGECEIPFVITYNGNEYLLKDEKWYSKQPYSAWVNVGTNMRYLHGGVAVDNGQYHRNNGVAYLNNVYIAYDESVTWKDVAPSDEEMDSWGSGGRPRMYNYTFKGWQDYTGRPYEPDDGLVTPSKNKSYFYAVDLFEDENGKKYAVEAKGIDEPMIDNSTTPSRPSYGGGSGGGGTGSGSRSGLSSRDYTLHGTWVVDGNGWKFRTDSGAYATNTWGFINGRWYFFDANGRMVVGWYQVNGLWYFLTPEAGANQGAMATGWRFDDAYKAWFYLNASGAMTTGWQQVNGLWYYLNPISDGTQGAMAANTTIDGYYVNSDGVWIP